MALALNEGEDLIVRAASIRSRRSALVGVFALTAASLTLSLSSGHVSDQGARRAQNTAPAVMAARRAQGATSAVVEAGRKWGPDNRPAVLWI